MQGYVWLALVIVSEVIGTTALKATAGFTRLGPSVAVPALPMGVTYAIWSGAGIVLITLTGWWLYGQKPDWAAVAGMALIIAGVVVIQRFSAMMERGSP